MCGYVLSFMKEFREPILSGRKIFTTRVGSDIWLRRWERGRVRLLSIWVGNVRFGKVERVGLANWVGLRVYDSLVDLLNDLEFDEIAWIPLFDTGPFEDGVWDRYYRIWSRCLDDEEDDDSLSFGLDPCPRDLVRNYVEVLESINGSEKLLSGPISVLEFRMLNVDYSHLGRFSEEPIFWLHPKGLYTPDLFSYS